MQDHDWIDLLRLIPESQQNVLVLTTLTGVDLNVETILRAELTYLVFRGRVSGQTDDGRVFFLPYRQIDYLQINRVVKETEIRELFGDRAEGAAAAPGGEPPSVPATSILPNAASQSGIFPSTAPAAAGLPLSPAAAAPLTLPTRHSIPPAPAARLSTAPGAGAPPAISARLSNAPSAGAPIPPQPPPSGRLPSNVPSAALIPQPAVNGGHAPEAPAQPRNSILERLRAQRNQMLPPRPPGR